MSFTDAAICLRRSDYSETSLVLRMMTRLHGQVALIAKGVKRPKSRFGGSIDLLAVGQAVFTLPRESSVSTMGILTAWDQTAVYPVLRTDLLRYAAATTAAELLTRLTAEVDPHPAGFDAMIRYLDALQAGEPPIRRLADFGRTLLAEVGLTPNFEICVACGQEVPSAKCQVPSEERGSGGRGSGVGAKRRAEGRGSRVKGTPRGGHLASSLFPRPPTTDPRPPTPDPRPPTPGPRHALLRPAGGGALPSLPSNPRREYRRDLTRS